MAVSQRALVVTAALLVLTACSDAGSGGANDPGPSLAAEATAAATTPVPEAPPTVAADAADSHALVVRNGSLVNGTGEAPVKDAVVVVEDGLITAVGPESQVAVPENAQVVDAAGGTILPGLIDTHTHHLDRLLIEDGKVDEATARLFLVAVIRSGVTTYRDLGSQYADSASLSDMRAALAAMGDQAPTVVIAGPIIASEDNWAATQFPEQVTTVADASAAAATADRLLDAGVDQIKIMVENAEFTGNPTPSLTAEQIGAITDAIHARDGTVVAHVSDIAEAELALAHGADELTHWPGRDPLPDDLIEALAARPTPVGTTFTIAPAAEGDLRRLLDAGGMIVVSTDAPGAASPTAIATEMRRMVDAGMTPMETIVAATHDGAIALGLEDRIGTVEVGKTADIIVVAADPLADITAIANVTNVIVRGTLAFSHDPVDESG